MKQRAGLGRVSIESQIDCSELTKAFFFALCTERLIELLHEFPPDEPTRKRFIQEMIGWSARFGPLERGDPELHHAAGSVYAQGRLSQDVSSHHILTACQTTNRTRLRNTLSSARQNPPKRWPSWSTSGTQMMNHTQRPSTHRAQSFRTSCWAIFAVPTRHLPCSHHGCLPILRSAPKM